MPSTGAKRSESSLRARVDAIREITDIFRFERLAYLVIIIASLVLLLACGIVSLYRGQIDDAGKVIGGVSAAGGSGGALGLLYMWKRSVTLALLGSAAEAEERPE